MLRFFKNPHANKLLQKTQAACIRLAPSYGREPIKEINSYPISRKAPQKTEIIYDGFGNVYYKDHSLPSRLITFLRKAMGEQPSVSLDLYKKDNENFTAFAFNDYWEGFNNDIARFCGNLETLGIKFTYTPPNPKEGIRPDLVMNASLEDLVLKLEKLDNNIDKEIKCRR